MLLLLPQDEFELNLLFQKRQNPKKAFDKISEAFSCLNTIDEYYLSLADDSLLISYELQDLEYSSIRAKIAQIIRGIPDEAIGELDWRKLLGHFLLKLKYRLLKFLEETKEVDSSSKLEKLIKDIEVDKKSILGRRELLLNEASIFILFGLIEKLVNSINKLDDDEKLEYASEFGIAKIDNTVSFNSAKILWDLGNKSSSSETTEILKIKSTDFLSREKMWAFKLKNKSINAKITDYGWLNKYYKRDFPLLPNDSLKVKLKVFYSSKESGEIYSPHYEITEVLEVIYPENQVDDLLF